MIAKKPMTPWGYQALAEEHRQLLEEERPRVVEGVATAAAEGDRSENAEYIYGKKRLREIDKRLRYLSGLITDVRIVNPSFIRSDKVEFGATVTLLDEHGNEAKYMIVGVGENDASRGMISWESPLAKAILNKREGDLVLFHRPKGELELEIIKIEYRSLENLYNSGSK